MAAEKIDDARRAAQIAALAGRRVPGEEGFEQMHVRVGAPQPLARPTSPGSRSGDDLRDGRRGRERLRAEPQRIGIAGEMRVRQRQQHAGMVVGVLDRIGDRAVDIERAHPAAAVGAAVVCDEVDAVRDQPSAGPSQPRSLATAKA